MTQAVSVTLAWRKRPSDLQKVAIGAMRSAGASAFKVSTGSSPTQYIVTLYYTDKHWCAVELSGRSITDAIREVFRRHVKSAGHVSFIKRQT